MPMTVTVSEAKDKFSSLLHWTVDNSGVVIIESRGKPRVFIVSYAEYQEFLTLREQARRKEALQS
jgi:prevent-host-death family protein